MTNLTLEPQTSALILMDFQGFVLKNFMSPEIASQVVSTAAHILKAARHAGLPVIHVMVSFRSDYPEISDRNAMFSWLRDNGLIKPGSEEMQIDASLAPHEQEPVIIKHRIGAFSGTDLDMILRANGIQTVLLAGVTTSGVVLSTFRQAFDLDYNVVVVEDACADSDANMQAFLMEKLIPPIGSVVTSKTVIRDLS
ncbi:cysteine hydrolase family protein [Gluconobacter sp.]|uniref:cysteine hydrolase family protein n=1 Tax=Gluconobacter sp. TaxID=1876758 RepID=UPI0039E943F7